MHCQPGVQTAQWFDDAAVCGAHQCEHAAYRQTIGNAPGDRRRGQVLRHSSVKRQSPIGVGLEQAARQDIGMPGHAEFGRQCVERDVVDGGHLLRVVAERLAARQQQYGAQQARRVEHVRHRPCVTPPRCAMGLVLFTDQSLASELVGLLS